MSDGGPDLLWGKCVGSTDGDLGTGYTPSSTMDGPCPWVYSRWAAGMPLGRAAHDPTLAGDQGRGDVRASVSGRTPPYIRISLGPFIKEGVM